MGDRNILAPDGTCIQQGMVFDPADYNNYNMTRPMLGIVMDVHLADDSTTNRLALQYMDQRGPVHLASVQLLDDGGPADLPHPEVVITPDNRTGIDDYSENLPKGSTCLLTGDELNNGLHNIDPNTLDGDMCVVMFVGGRLNSGFIVRWWPHTFNTFDPATSGEGNRDISGEGTTLAQSGRSFTRVNGVEYVVTREGNVYLSTSLGGTKLIPGQGSQIGRFARTRLAKGGNIRVWVKPTALMEIDFNFQEDGIGSGNAHDPSLPQTNPPGSTPFSVLHNGSLALDGTYMRFEEKKVDIEVPEDLRLKSNNRTSLEAANELSLKSSGITSIDSESVISLESRADILVAARGPLSLAGSSVAIEAGVPVLDAGGGIVIGPVGAGQILIEEDGTVLLGPDTGIDVPDKQAMIVDGAVADPLDTVLGKNQVLLDTEVKAAVAAISSAGATPTPAATGTALAAIGVALDAINSLLQELGVTEFTKAN